MLWSLGKLVSFVFPRVLMYQDSPENKTTNCFPRDHPLSVYYYTLKSQSLFCEPQIMLHNFLSVVLIKRFGDIQNNQGLGKCFQPKLKSEGYMTNLVINHFGYHQKVIFEPKVVFWKHYCKKIPFIICCHGDVILDFQSSLPVFRSFVYRK